MITDRNDKDYEEYGWYEMTQIGQLGHLKVAELDKYLKHHHLSEKGKKADNVRRVLFHLCNDISNKEM